jgi:hypothetical protein
MGPKSVCGAVRLVRPIASRQWELQDSELVGDLWRWERSVRPTTHPRLPRRPLVPSSASDKRHRIDVKSPP